MISFLKVINQELCSEQQTIKNRNECFKNSTSDSYCCFNSNSNNCVLVKKNELNNKNSQYDCSISEENYGKYEFREYHPNQTFDLGFQTCGETGPKKKEDCIKYSEITNSCCFFQKVGSSDETACLAIGRKFNETLFKGKYSYENEEYEYNCKSSNLILSLYSFLLVGLNLL